MKPRGSISSFGAKLVTRAESVIVQPAGAAVPRKLFAANRERIRRLRPARALG
jgi:hypothetical protein